MHHFLIYTFISIYRSDDLNLREDLLDSLHVVNLELFFSIIFFRMRENGEILYLYMYYR